MFLRLPHPYMRMCLCIGCVLACACRHSCWQQGVKPRPVAVAHRAQAEGLHQAGNQVEAASAEKHTRRGSLGLVGW